jgi:acetoin utilization deacetylase AcuC-like enzyme
VRQAKAAASALCRLVSRVVQTSDLDNGFAVIRPPGHHAEPGLAGGYCVVNNVAVAAAYAREKLGVERVLVVDWDVHHGNGTQRIFLNDPAVLYFSVHRWHGGNFFPFLKNGGATTVGVGEGAGFNVNVGWSRKGMGDDEYEAVWTKVLMPMAREYQPDLVLVSAGFDAADGDMGECNVTPECFGMLTRSLKTLADGKVICSLEGGYVRGVLGECVKQVVSALLEPKSACEQQVSEEAEDGTDILEEIDPSAAKNIRATIAAHQTYWKCFQQG